MSTHRSSVPLIPRRHLAGIPVGQMRARRRGRGLDLVGARPYRAGDDIRTIDHRASARLSSASGDDQLLVREYLTEESARVVVVIDRSPSMGLFPSRLPWLSKPDALREAVRVILDSATDAHCLAGMLDCRSPHRWLAPDGRTSADELGETAASSTFDAPAGALDHGLRSMLEIERGLHSGTFVFVISDFINPPEASVWEAMLARHWDVVPVVTQDPVWEKSFPAVAGALLAVADPQTGSTSTVRLTEHEVGERRAANEARIEALGARFRSLGLDTVEVPVSDPAE
ncbi:MAG: DUF58 domain-containing protein, partial [Gaiellaceae bacterium]